MAIQRKPVAGESSGSHQPLPYPVSPVSARHEPFAHVSGFQPGAEGQAPMDNFMRPPQFNPSQSTSNVSDLSDGWVDGATGEGLEGTGHNPVGQHLEAFPTALKIGHHSNYSQTSSVGSGVPDTGFERLERPGTAQSNKSNNPFHRDRSAEGQGKMPLPQTSNPENDIWTEIAAPQPQEPQPHALGYAPSLPGMNKMAISEPALQNQTAGWQPPVASDSQSNLPLPTGSPAEARQSFELPASPVQRNTAGQAGRREENSDIWAQLDTALNPSQQSSLEHSEKVWADAPIPVIPYRAPTFPPPPAEIQQSENSYAPPMAPPPSAIQQPQNFPGQPMPPTLSKVEGKQPMPINAENVAARAPPNPFANFDGAYSSKMESAFNDGIHERVEPLTYEPPSTMPATATAGPRSENRDQKLPAAEQAPFRAAPMSEDQKRETYAIKQILWFDESIGDMRTTPIMVQNANGPCPLLALVNALTLSTPAGVDTALVGTLRTREQVSLGFLLDAVFDELMSGRRGGAAQQLPDVSELYGFLLTLHTGMNVNPRFVGQAAPATPLIEGLDNPTVEDQYRGPGGFEDTREMMLYGAFAVPLVHGWLPPKRHPACTALMRSANTYEDAQNLMFREEELEDKLQVQGLTSEEQQLLQDITSIKAFLQSSATQLTGYGLDIVADTLAPGSIAILFRNDHFSTLYKHPRSGQLLSLVTDYGYAGHAEVVWESLVDVSGEACEFYSGDFRPVGDTAPQQGPQDTDWTASPQQAPMQSAAPVAPISTTPGSPTAPARNTEQEDADLALAMQLQEEEDDQHRRAEQARREEERASQAYISSAQAPTPPRARAGAAGAAAGRTPPAALARVPSAALAPATLAPTTTGRRQSTNQHTSSSSSAAPANPALPTRPRPAPPRAPDPEAGEDAPPPTYEQAAKAAPYTGPIPSPGGSAADSYGQMRASNGASRDVYTRQRGMSAYSQARGGFPAQASGQTAPPSAEAARRRASAAAAASYDAAIAGAGSRTGDRYERERYEADQRERYERERERDKDCVVM